MQYNISLLFALSRANAVMARRLSGHGLSFSDFIILHHLNQAPEQKLRRVDLAHKMGLTASGVTRMLLPLEKLHIISRDQNGDDARARYARLTDAGKELLSDATATLEMNLADYMPKNSKFSIKDLTSLLDEMTENMLEPEYRQEAKVRWGNTDAYKQSTERLKKMSKDDLESIKKEGEALTQDIADAMILGAASTEVQNLIAKHYDNLRHFYEPNIQMYQGLGEMYASDPRFSAYYEKFAPGLAQFMYDAIKIFCAQNKK